MIWPVKVFRGKQPYDTVQPDAGHPAHRRQRRHRLLEELQLGEGHRRRHDRRPARRSAASIGFVETEMSWPITHMVAPKDERAGLRPVPQPTSGRLQKVAGIYMPGPRRQPAASTSSAGRLALLTLPRGAGPRRAAHLRRNRKGSQDHGREASTSSSASSASGTGRRPPLIIFMLITGFEVHGSLHAVRLRERGGAAHHRRLDADRRCGCSPSSGTSPPASGSSTSPPSTRSMPWSSTTLTGIFTHAPHPFRATTLTQAQPAAAARLSVLLADGLPADLVLGLVLPVLRPVARVGRGRVPVAAVGGVLPHRRRRSWC
ncbi:MAG: hypothetical protein MZW92_46410 [Comamonadaceae bacterium]|nr:hypothetical protein [Comamonadaceae bacterium]